MSERKRKPRSQFTPQFRCQRGNAENNGAEKRKLSEKKSVNIKINIKTLGAIQRERDADADLNS